MTNPAADHDLAPLKRLPRKPLPHYTKTIIPVQAFLSALLLGLALPGLIGADGLIDYAKCVVAAISAGLTAFAINRLAIEKGALQAAIGTPGAGLVSTLSILIVGFGMFAATYGGFTIGKTDQFRLMDFGQAQTVFVADQLQDAQQASRIGRALGAITDDLTQKAECERTASCFGNAQGTGEGPIYRALLSEAQRADTISRQWIEGEAVFAAALSQLSEQDAALQRIVADTDLSVSERRTQAQRVGSEMAHTLSTAREAQPVVMVAAYAQSLRTPVIIQEHPDVTAKLNALRAGYAGELGTVIASLDTGTVATPLFPATSGVSDTLFQVGHFLPLALILFVIELVFPVTLWLSTLFGFLARLEREEPADAAAANHPRPNALINGDASKHPGNGSERHRRPSMRRNHHHDV